jgi:hypothetical protein
MCTGETCSLRAGTIICTGSTTGRAALCSRNSLKLEGPGGEGGGGGVGGGTSQALRISIEVVGGFIQVVHWHTSVHWQPAPRCPRPGGPGGPGDAQIGLNFKIQYSESCLEGMG